MTPKFNLPPGESLQSLDPPNRCPWCGQVLVNGDECPHCVAAIEDDLDKKLRGYPVAEAILLNHPLYEFRDDE